MIRLNGGEFMKILVCANQKSQNYIDAIESLSASCVFEYSPEVSAVVFCGGNDIFPGHYNEEMNGSLNPDYARDERELEIFKMAQEAINLAPAFAGFIEFKERQLGKEAKYFNELEKYQTLDEFKKMYYKANELLNNGI